MEGKILTAVKAAAKKPVTNCEAGEVRAAFAALADAQWGVCNLPAAKAAMAAYAPLDDRIMEARELLRAGQRGGIHRSAYSGTEAEARRARGLAALPVLMAEIEACAAMMDAATA